MTDFTSIDRRTFATSASFALIGAAMAAGSPATGAQAQLPSSVKPKAGAKRPAAVGEPFRVGMFVFNDMTHLDFVGPHHVLSRPPNVEMHILATTLDPITTDSGSRILADTLVSDAPKLDLIFVPGGDVNAMMRDERVLSFLREREPQARYVTSVCTGALVLGAAGLLRGYKAATHWTTMDILPIMGAIPVHQRVVTDRNRITGGGVTAGIDFGLTVAAEIWGPEVAKTIQLASEYDPAPPFDSGSPGKASPQAIAAVKNMVEEGSKRMREAAHGAAKKFA